MVRSVLIGAESGKTSSSALCFLPIRYLSSFLRSFFVRDGYSCVFLGAGFRRDSVWVRFAGSSSSSCCCRSNDDGDDGDDGSLADLTQQVAQLAAELTPAATRSCVHDVTEQDLVECQPHQLRAMVAVQGAGGCSVVVVAVVGCC